MHSHTQLNQVQTRTLPAAMETRVDWLAEHMRVIADHRRCEARIFEMCIKALETRRFSFMVADQRRVAADVPRYLRGRSNADILIFVQNRRCRQRTLNQIAIAMLGDLDFTRIRHSAEEIWVQKNDRDVRKVTVALMCSERAIGQANFVYVVLEHARVVATIEN